jgi:hypothetical protein
LVVEAKGGAAEDTEEEDGIAVAHAARVLTCTDIESLVQASFDVPIATDALQEFGAS